MADEIHPAATHHLPVFVTAPGETDVLLVFTAIVVVLGVIGIGVFYFRLHALPEQLAHRGEKVQMEIVAVLTLIALFTHNHVFWIAALLLALIPLPDFTTPLRSIARSLEQLAAGAPPPAVAEAKPAADGQAVKQASDAAVSATRLPPPAVPDEALPEQRRA
jgi:hypothetical protein